VASGAVGADVQVLEQGQQAGAVPSDARITEVMALLASTCQGVLHTGWDSDLQHRTLAISFDGLRPAARS
jgi:hypothetical protein